MSNSNLFKQAIAEAKSVREAAITNAKQVLEESITPHLKNMLAARLQEIEDEDAEEDLLNREEVPTMEPQEEEIPLNEPEEEEVPGQEDQDEDDREIGDLSVEEFKDLIRGIIGTVEGEEHGEEEAPEQEPEHELGSEMDGGEVPEEEEIDLDELLREIDTKEDEAIEENYMDAITVVGGATGLAAAAGFAGVIAKLAASGVMNALETGSLGEKGKQFADQLKRLADAAKKNPPVKEVAELAEAVKTVSALREEVQEVNLLNAKLLYVSKILKASTLSESQKVNVIAAFDKAETAREAKLVYQTVSESLTVTKKQPMVKEARLGSASRAVGTPVRKPEIISEGAEMVKRWQKLAGIITE